MSQEPEQNGDMWTPYKGLLNIVRNAITRPTPGIFKDLDDALRKHKQNFITLLKNPPKNAKNRAELQKAITDGIKVAEVNHRTVSKDLVEEAIIISDMYNLNEIVALDLLLTAEYQMPNNPGNTRGLVAILLYYDGRKALVSTLRILIQARRGFTWSIECPDEIINYITEYTDKLVQDGLLLKILDLIESMDLSKELSLLQQNRALGGPRHQHQVVDLFETIKQNLADILFLWSAQCGLPREPTLRLINQLKKCSGQNDASGKIDNITLALEMSLLYALDLGLLQRREDGEEIVQHLPLIKDAGFLPALSHEFSSTTTTWQNVGLQALSVFAWSVSLSTLKIAPQNLHPKGDAANILDEDSAALDAAIEGKVFEYLYLTFLQNETIYKEEYYLRRLHSLITDFIVHMPLKVKELRNRGDETAHTIQVYAQEGLDPPLNLAHHFEHLLLAISRLYQKDPLHLNLVTEYWCPVESGKHVTYSYQAAPRQSSLFKFICLAGDLLPAALFIPYVKMLSSLSSSPETAGYAFNMLKRHEPSSTLSWDHFFSSLNRYYSNLRQELPPNADTVYRSRSYPRGITPHEIQGLQVVLGLTRIVAENDEFARLALCENPNWSAITVLLGLVTCSVPIPLKAELILTLSAFAKSPVTATTLWQNLEASQIVSTIPSTSSYQPRGVQTELEEVESRNEEFPLTRSILHLLDILTDVTIPRLIGMGTRNPGFHPYLQFILNSVLLRFNTRSYKNPEEKWQIAESGLKLLVKFLNQYTLAKEDFFKRHIEVQSGGKVLVDPPPGFHLLIHLNSKSELLRLVLYLIHEGCSLLDTFSPFPGKESLEKTTQYCLELLARTLEQQNKFFEFLISADSNLIVNGLSKLLFDTNPRSGQPDHLLNITKYVTYNSWLPHHAMSAVSILLAITRSPSVHTQLISLYTATPSLSVQILHGFVECLECSDHDEPMDTEEFQTEEEEEYGVQTYTKEIILNLLKQCLNDAAPNITHFLLGFELNKDIKKMLFQRPGLNNQPRNCLHSIISILDLSLHARSLMSYSSIKPRLLEKAYCILHALCSNVKTSEPVLRFLRASDDFLHRHVSGLPFIGPNKVCELNQMAWLLRAAAIEIKVTASKQQQSTLSKLVSVFVEQRMSSDTTAMEESMSESMNESRMLHQLSHITPAEASTVSLTPPRPEKREMLLRLLSFVNFSAEQVPKPIWEFFDSVQIDKLLIKCETNTAPGLNTIDMKKLHRTLMNELTAVQSTATAGQRQLFLKETQSILTYALKHNVQRSRAVATVQFMDSWRQVTEVLFAVTSTDIVPLETRIKLLIECIHLLLSKAVGDSVIPDVALKCSGNVMLLLAYLRCDLMLQNKRQAAPEHAVDFVTSETAGKSNALILKIILSNILKWIVGSGVPLQKLRLNLYAALLNYLHITFKNKATKQRDVSDDDDLYVSRLDNTSYRITRIQNDRVRYSILEVLLKEGEIVIDALCHDCINGHDICKMLALSCLSTLLELDVHGQWVTFLSSQGHIQLLIESIRNADSKLTTVLESVPNSLAPLYVYESQMALLCRIASTRNGAEILLSQGALTSFSSMLVYDKHPEIRTTPMELDMDFIPSVASRYMQVLFPALNMCSAILMSLQSQNQTYILQVLCFLMSHRETVYMTLRAGSPYMHSMFLNELSKLTAVIAQSSTIVSDAMSMETITPVVHDIECIKDHMFLLLPRFIVSDSVLREITNSSSSSPQKRPCVTNPTEVSRNGVWFFQIACNLIHYCQNLMSSRNVDSRAANIIFKPSITDGRSLDRRARGDFSSTNGPPNLGIIVQQLVQSVDYLHKEKSNLRLLARKLDLIASMNASELEELLPNVNTSQSSIQQIRTQASQYVESQVKIKTEELKYCSFLIENCLYIVWCHLDYYMLRALPQKNTGLSFDTSVAEELSSPYTEVSWKVTVEDLSSMKQGLMVIFNDSFSKKLVDVAEGQTSLDKGFLEAFLRRIKKLIQFVPVK